MKRLFLLILTSALLLVLCACESKAVDSSPQIEVNLPHNDQKVPSSEMIEKDIANALLQKNPTVEITTIETVKSLTGDSNYEITLQVMAQSKYADWLYEPKLCYTKYDQGWMLDRVGWGPESYTQTRVPDLETMVNYASIYLPLHEVNDLFDHILPIQNPVITTAYDDNKNEEILTFNWDTTYQEMYSEATLSYTSQWEYDALSDHWDLVGNDNNYQIDFTFKSRTFNSNLDFSGEWHAAPLSPTITLGGYGTIIISNYSWDGFNVYVPGLEEHYVIDPYFARTDVNEAGVVTFTNSEGHYIDLAPQGNQGLRIKLWMHGTNIAVAEAQVDKELPTLS